MHPHIENELSINNSHSFQSHRLISNIIFSSSHYYLCISDSCSTHSSVSVLHILIDSIVVISSLEKNIIFFFHNKCICCVLILVCDGWIIFQIFLLLLLIILLVHKLYIFHLSGNSLLFLHLTESSYLQGSIVLLLMKLKTVIDCLLHKSWKSCLSRLSCT